MDRSVIERLCAVPGRGACTDAERRAAGVLHAAVRAGGGEAYVEARWTRPQRRASLAGHAALAVAAALASVAVPVPAAAVAAFAALSLALEATGRTAPLAHALPRRATQHVLTAPADGDVTLLIVAGYDAPRREPGRAAGWLAGSPNRAAGWLAGSPGRAAGWLAGAAAVVAAAAGARALGVEGTWLGVVELVATVLLLAGAAAAVDAAGRPWARGAGRAAGVAVALALYEELRRDPPRALAPALLLLGAREPGPQTLRAHLRAERAGPRDTVVLELGPLGSGPAAWGTGHPQLRAAAKRASAALALPAAAGPRPPAGARRLPAIAIAGPPPAADAPEAIDDAALDAALDLALAVVDALDADLARPRAASTAEAA